jgi:photosystem II biogenesis protein Psp29
VNNVPTVSETKRAFYAAHTRPINSIYRRVVEELMVEMHLLSVNTTFAYDAIYALGITTTYERFMDGYRPEGDRTSIFNALCQALKSSPGEFHHDGDQVLEATKALSIDHAVEVFSGDVGSAPEPLRSLIEGIKANPNFKYSRLFGVGLATLLDKINPTLLLKEETRKSTIKSIAEGLGLPQDKLLKDIETYRDNLEKMAQVRIVMEEAIIAERKKREQREQDRQAKASDAASPITPEAVSQ